MRRILYLEDNTDGTVGGSYFSLLAICRKLDRSKYFPVVVFFRDHTLVPAFRQTGAEVMLREPLAPFLVHRRLGPAGRTAQSLINLFKTFVLGTAAWRRFLRAHDIALVHLNNACCLDQDLMLAAHREGIPCVVHERGIQRTVSGKTRFFARRVDRIITISKAVHDNLVAKGIPSAKLLQIDNGVDPERLTQEQPAAKLREQWQVPPGAPIVGIVGNVKYWKGQETVIRAVGRIRPRFPTLRCFVVGTVTDPHYMQRLDKLVAELGLEDLIIFTGYQKRAADLIELFDVFVLASVEPEPFGIVLLEAMGKGKPIVATDFGGPKEIVVEGDTGYLTPPKDDAALARRLEELLASGQLRHDMGERGRARFHAYYSAERTVRRIEALYDELFGQP